MNLVSFWLRLWHNWAIMAAQKISTILLNYPTNKVCQSCLYLVLGIYNIGLTPIYSPQVILKYVVNSHKYVFVKFVNLSWEQLCIFVCMFRIWKTMMLRYL